MITVTLILPLAAACFEEEPQPGSQTALTIEPSALLQDANQRVRDHLTQAESVALGLDGVELLNGLLPLGSDAPCTGTPCPPSTSTTSQAAKIADDIATYLLHEDRMESSDETQVTLLFDGAVCSIETSSPDPDCVAVLNAQPIRMVLRSYQAGNVSVDILVGATRAPLGRLELFASHLASEIDLGVAKAFIEDVAPMTGDAAEIEVIAQANLQGRARFELRQEGAMQYRTSVALTAPVIIDVPIEGETVQLNLQPANPLFSVQLDATSKTVSVDVQSGGATARLPTEMFAQDEEICDFDANGILVCESAGVSNIFAPGMLTFDIPAGSSSLLIDESDTMSGTTQWSGPARVSLGGVEVLSMDLSSGQGRRIDYDLQATDRGLRFAASPGMASVVNLALAPLFASEMQAEMPSWMQNETMTVRLDGAAQPALLLGMDGQALDPNAPPPAFSIAAEVDAGRLFMQSQATNTQLEVRAGQCLRVIETSDAQGPVHPMQMLEAGACR